MATDGPRQATFWPGTPIKDVPKKPEPRRLYGLAVGADWVTFLIERDRNGQRWKWCSRLRDGGHSGNRTEFLTWLGELRGVQAT